MLYEKFVNKIYYPKLIILLVCIVAAYALFQAGLFDRLPALLHGRGYISALLAGFFFSYGFTAPFAVGVFIAIAPEINIFAGALLAGIGAVTSDLLIFRFIRGTFQEEFDRLKLSRLVFWVKEKFDGHFSEEAEKYLLWVFAGFLIASPLPDEFGVSLLSGFTQMNQKVFYALAYSLNTIGIFLIFLLGDVAQ